MIIKTRGIVLSYSKYKDTSIIVRILTEDHGLHSFIVNNIRSARSKRSIGVFQPFSLLEVLSYWKDTSSIHRLSDVKIIQPLHRIQADIRKATLSLFLSEILLKIFHHEQTEQQATFAFVMDSILALEHMTEGVENFHLQFLLKLANYLGFGFEQAYQIAPKEVRDEPVIEMLQKEEYGIKVNIGGNQRFSILDSLLRFYQTQMEYISGIKSLKVLHQVFH